MISKENRKIEFWVNVYEHHINEVLETKEEADTSAIGIKRIACLHFNREFEEGEGL